MVSCKVNGVENNSFTKRMSFSVIYISSCFSPCQLYYAALNSFGFVMVYKTPQSREAGDNNDHKPLFTLKISEKPAFSITTIENCLVLAGYDQLKFFSWDDLKIGKLSCLWAEKECSKYSKAKYISKVTHNAGVLYCGDSDGQITSFDIETGQKIFDFVGHDNYIHDLSTFDNGFVSVSEDGCMKIWDVRGGNMTSEVQPHLKHDLSRPKLGKFLKCVTSDAKGDWIICGGGPKLTMYSRNNLELYNPLEIENNEFVANVVDLFNEEIVAAGNESCLRRWHMNGKSKTNVVCEINSAGIFSIASTVSAAGKKGLPVIVCGSDQRIPVFLNFGYQATSLKSI